MLVKNLIMFMKEFKACTLVKKSAQINKPFSKKKIHWFQINRQSSCMSVPFCGVLTLYSIITSFDAYEISVVESIIENVAFALLEQMFHFS